MQDGSLANEHCGAQHGRPAATEGAIENDGKSLVGDHVAQQKSDQNPMFAALQESENPGRILLLSSFT